MECKYDRDNKCLRIGEEDIPAYDIEENDVGICQKCGCEIVSISYHSSKDKMIVVSRCLECDSFYAIIYDPEWNWVGELPISEFFSCDDVAKVVNDNSLELLESIPIQRLKSVFSPSELDAMFAKAKGEKYVRQYLYRARKKYPHFEELFGISLDI